MLLWFLHQINLFYVHWIYYVYYHNIKIPLYILAVRSNHVVVKYRNIFSCFAISIIKPIWSEQIVSFLWLCLVDLGSVVPQSFDSIDHHLCFWPFCHANPPLRAFISLILLHQNYIFRLVYGLHFNRRFDIVCITESQQFSV